jgi:UPF0716 family protein affecting phage T7 exclusion
MGNKSRGEMLKLIGGGLIVATAFILMMPGWIDYIMRIGRTLLLVFLALGIALVVVFVYHKLFGTKKRNESPQSNETNSKASAGVAEEADGMV